MIQPANFFAVLKEHGINFFTGVPDSLFKDFCAYITDHTNDSEHVIAANEGNAVALAAGYYLGTAKPALVYLQNSGLGNAVNPLLSLNDPEVYGLPVLLLIGWRGEPGLKDEPQHMKQGRITPHMLDIMEIPWQILDANTKDPQEIVTKAMYQMLNSGGPAALLVRKGAFDSYVSHKNEQSPYLLSREQAIQQLVDQIQRDDLVVATTGMPGRELYEYRVNKGDGVGRDFLTVGSMGHAASIALGLAISQPNRLVFCLDGDGALLMHMGGLAIIGQSKQRNLVHIVLNNGAHDSVGGQPTCAFAIDIAGIARACGYQHISVAKTHEEITASLKSFISNSGPSFLEIRIKKGARNNLGRPKSTPSENRNTLMTHLGVKK